MHSTSQVVETAGAKILGQEGGQQLQCTGRESDTGEKRGRATRGLHGAQPGVTSYHVQPGSDAGGQGEPPSPPGRPVHLINPDKSLGSPGPVGRCLVRAWWEGGCWGR